MKDNPWCLNVALHAPLLPSHSYGVDGNGVEIPSVTKIVNPRSVISNFRSPAMQRGTRVHQRIEDVILALCHGERLTKKLCGSDDIAPLVYDMVLLYRRKVHRPKTMVETEVSFVAELSHDDDAYCFAGTMDLLERTKEDAIVLDWKTGQPHPWHHLQVAMYMLAVGASSGALIYPNGVEWVSPIACDAVVDLIKAYHARQILANDKKKVMAQKINRWQRGQKYA